MAHHPYHHGNLRAVLLLEAQRVLRDRGIDQLSLRDLARHAGVTPAAPRRHFADRQALIDALVEAGFDRLSDDVCAAIETAGVANNRVPLQAMASAYVKFAIEDGALLELMFSTKGVREAGTLPASALTLFAAVGELIRRGQRAGEFPPGDPERLRLLLVATLQGIAALVTSRRVSPDQVDPLVADAVRLFTPGWKSVGVE